MEYIIGGIITMALKLKAATFIGTSIKIAIKWFLIIICKVDKDIAKDTGSWVGSVVKGISRDKKYTPLSLLRMAVDKLSKHGVREIPNEYIDHILVFS